MDSLNGYTTLLVQIIAHPLVLMVLGLLTHFVKALAEIKKNVGREVRVNIRTYYFDNPYHTALAILGALVGYALLIGDEDVMRLSDTAANALRINAFFIGYMADSMLDILGQRSTVNKPKEPTP